MHFHHVFVVSFPSCILQSVTSDRYLAGRSQRNPSVGLGTGRTSAVGAQDDVVWMGLSPLHLKQIASLKHSHPKIYHLTL